MNFFNSALEMAKSAAEAGTAQLQTVASTATSRLQEATGVEIPTALPISSAITSVTGGGAEEAQANGADGKPAEGGEEKKDDEESFGRLNAKLDFNFERGTLAVTIVQCENLPAMDMGGTSDPYVKVYVMPDKKKKYCTKKLKKTLNPVYNETFQFQKLPFNEMGNKTLIFAVYDHDALGADDQIGEVQIPLANIDLGADDLEFWWDIKEPPKNVLGDICISLRYKPQSKPPVLVIVVVECKNLKQMDLGGASDPYVKVNHMVDGKRIKKYKTTVQESNLNPYWNTTFKIQVNPYELQKLELQVMVNDFDKFGSNDTIGWIMFSPKDQGTPGKHWMEALTNPKKNITRWHALQPCEEDK